MTTPLEKYQAHRIECLEATVRKYRQAARALSLAVTGDYHVDDIRELAQRVRKLIQDDEKADGS